MDQLLQVGGTTLTPNELLACLRRYQLLPQLERELRIDGAIADIVCSEKEVQFACEQFYGQRQLQTAEQRQQWHQRQGLSTEDLTVMASRQVRLAKFKQQTWGHQVESYFLKRKSALDEYRFSILRLPTLGIAQELFYRLELGEQTFAQVVAEQGNEAEKPTGGRMGPIALGQLAPPLAQRLKSHPPGTVVPPFELGDEVVLMQVEQVQPARLDERMRRQLLDELFEQWIATQ